MSPRSRGLLVQAVCLALVVAVAGRLLWWSLAVRAAPLAAVSRVEPWWVPSSVLFVAAGCFVLGALGAGRDRRGSVLPILTVVYLFVEVLVLGSVSTPERPDEELERGLNAFCEQARGAKSAGEVAALEQDLDGVEPPPYFVKGSRVERLHVRVVVESDCASVPPGVAPLTFLWCTQGTRTRGRVVALPAEKSRGEPVIFSRAGKPLGCDG